MVTQTLLTLKDGKKLTANRTETAKSWRMVHDKGKVKDYFEAEGVTYTKYSLFEGTKEECETEIKRLGLSVPADLKPDAKEIE